MLPGGVLQGMYMYCIARDTVDELQGFIHDVSWEGEMSMRATSASAHQCTH